MAIWQWILIGAGGFAAVAIAVGAVFRWLYVKVPANMAFIRTGLGGRKVVTDAGALILPVVHNIQWLSLETFKIEIQRANRDAFITKDRYRVDIGAEFYVKIKPDRDAIEAASRSLGDKSFSADGIMQLVEEKLVSAMRSAAAERELVELHENRRQFALQVRDDSMEPEFASGCVIVVDPTGRPRDGAFVLAELDDRFVFRRLSLTGAEPVLEALNPAYGPETCARDLAAIRGVVVAGMVLSSALGPGVVGALIDVGIGLDGQFWAMAVYTLGASSLFRLLQPKLSYSMA